MTNRWYAGRILMTRNKSLGKRLLTVGLMLIFSMSGCGTYNEIELTGNGIGSGGIEAAATVDPVEMTTDGETASDVLHPIKQTQRLPTADVPIYGYGTCLAVCAMPHR